MTSTSKTDKTVQQLSIKPEGYEHPIVIPVIRSGSREEAKAWSWNGSTEHPTVKPSIKTLHADGRVSHIWLTDGICEYLPDSTDGFAGSKHKVLQCSLIGGENE